MIFSKYGFAFHVGNDVALYNSLRMKPIYLSDNKFKKIKEIVDKNVKLSQDLKCEIDELIKYKILVKEGDDEKILNFVKSVIPQPQINVCYFILSEQCNLACKYCFLGNNNQEKRKRFKKENMSKQTAMDGILFFIKQLESANFDENSKPTILFYGGEPLLNFETLVFIVNKINELKKSCKVLEKVEFDLVTNGLLLNKQRLLKLNELGVNIGISIDGCNNETNKMRVDIGGNFVFEKIIQKLDLAKSLGVPVSLSVTLTQDSIKNKKDMLELVKKYNIKGFGFNILMSDKNISDLHYQKTSEFLIEMFKELRKLGIYEDRMMRKVKSFAKSSVYFSDCAATSGRQIVIAANGDVGICQGCLYDRKYFVTNILDENFNPTTNEIWQRFRHLSPPEKNECQECEALGICGGGCPISAANEKVGNTIDSLDRRFCIHAKESLKFLISDLHRIVIKGENSEIYEKCEVEKLAR